MRSVVVVVMVLMACGDDGGKPIDAAVVYEDARECVPGTQPLTTVYLNFGGGMYSQGADDATMNKAPILDMSRTLAAWPHANTAAVKTCMEEGLRPFRITVTDVDPGTSPHHEIVFTDVYWDPQAPAANILSISSTACGDTPTPNSITFVFGTPISADTTAACEAALAQFGTAAAHLDHTTNCMDYTGALSTACGPKSWTMTPSPCGELTARNCVCGGTHQISYMKMAAMFGASCAP